MPAFTIGDIVRGTRGALLGGDLGIAVAGISIDSRSLGVGDAFFAIRGERLDGHGFLRDAVGRGAACLVIHSVPDDLPPGVPVVLVDETTKALGRLAAWHRQRFSIPVAAVTGSTRKPSAAASNRQPAKYYLGTKVSHVVDGWNSESERIREGGYYGHPLAGRPPVVR